jgi:glyoxylase-like metal-dependent hydrolase (beta-lactamase superfamily II)
MINIGDIRIHLINDANILVDAGGAFGLVPRVLWRRVVEPVEEVLVPNTVTCLLVQVDGKNIVVDTGYGHKSDKLLERHIRLDRAHGDLIEGLARLGVQPADVDLVIDTHLHGDHAGGNTYLDDEGSIQPAFPNAEYIVQRREYDDAMRPNERTRATYMLENYAPLVESGRMRLLDGDEDILPGVRCVVTPGHTPGHMSVVFERDGKHAAFVCDMATMAVHFEKLGWMTAYDVEPLITLETKRLWQQWALDHDALLIFPHDPERHVCRLTETEDGKRRLIPVASSFA